MYGFARIYSLICLLVAVVSVGCDVVVQSGNSAASAPTNSGVSSISKITNLGEEVTTTTTTASVRNCGGGITSTTVSYSSAVENAVEWHVGVEVGVGANIGSNFVPGGLDLNAVLSGEIAPQLRAKNEQSVAHTLQGPPNAIMQYEIQWDITWRNIQLVVTTPLGTNENIGVRYVANISSLIASEQKFSCDGNALEIVPTVQSVQVTSGSPATLTVVTATPSSSIPIPSPFTADSYYSYGLTWQYDDSARTMTWIGSTDGREDVWEPEGEPLDKIRSGYTAIFGPMDVPGEIFACVLMLNDRAAKNTCGGANIPVEAGKTFRVISSGTVGGFRWCPASNMGYRKDNLGHVCQ